MDREKRGPEAKILNSGKEKKEYARASANFSYYFCSTAKGMSPLLEAVFIILVFVIGVSIVINVGMPSVDFAKASNTFSEAQNTMKLIDNGIQEVIREGAGAKRLLQFTSPGEFEVIPAEDSVQFKMGSTKLVEYLSRRFSGNIVQIGGGDVSCGDAGNLTLENSYLKVELQKIPQAAPLAALNTNASILSIKEKTFNNTVAIANSSIVINGNASTSSGTGYSEILRKGKDLPYCGVHFFVNSSVTYDVYYYLYAGADFVVMDVRNVK